MMTNKNKMMNECAHYVLIKFRHFGMCISHSIQLPVTEGSYTVEGRFRISRRFPDQGIHIPV